MGGPFPDISTGCSTDSVRGLSSICLRPSVHFAPSSRIWRSTRRSSSPAMSARRHPPGASEAVVECSRVSNPVSRNCHVAPKTWWGRLEDSLRLHGALAFALESAFPQAWASEIEGMRRELEGFLPRCVQNGSWFELERTPRHLRAIDFRVKRLHDKGPASERRDREALVEWVHRLEHARPLLAGTVQFTAYEHAIQERRAHLAVPSLALSGSGSRRVLVVRWNELSAVSAGRLVPIT